MSEESRLGGQLAKMGLRLVHLSETTSTNELASQLALEGEEHGLVVLADCQQAGRGRQGRSWSSPVGCGLFVSFLRRPYRQHPGGRAEAFGARDAWLWTLLAGVACHTAVSSWREDTWLKWPNDLFAGERKIGGTLCELQTGSNGQIESIVVGIGVNLHTPLGGWGDELEDRAGAVWPEVEPSLDFGRRDDLLIQIASQFTLLERTLDIQRPNGVLKDGREALLMRYRAAMAPMFGRHVTVELGGQLTEVTVDGISDKGALEVVDDKGQRQNLLAGDVHLHGQGAIRS